MAYAATSDYGRFAAILGPTLRIVILEHFMAAKHIWYGLRDVAKRFPKENEIDVANTLEELREQGVIKRKRGHMGYEYTFDTESDDSKILLSMYNRTLVYNAMSQVTLKS